MWRKKKQFLHTEQIRIQTYEAYPSLAEMFDICLPFEGLNLISGLCHPDKAGFHTVPENKPVSPACFFVFVFVSVFPQLEML